jgi:hypothetical protein
MLRVLDIDQEQVHIHCLDIGCYQQDNQSILDSYLLRLHNHHQHIERGQMVNMLIVMDNRLSHHDMNHQDIGMAVQLDMR